jgi:hypothetical protein
LEFAEPIELVESAEFAEFAQPAESVAPVTQAEAPVSTPIEPLALFEPLPTTTEPNLDQTADRLAATGAGGENPVTAEKPAPADPLPDSPAEPTSAPPAEPATTAAISQEAALPAEAEVEAEIGIPQADEAPVLLEAEPNPREIEPGGDAPESPESTEPTPSATNEETRPAA